MSGAVTERSGAGRDLARWADAGWPRWVLAVFGGLATGLSWEPYGLWPLLLVGIPALTLAVRGQRRRRAFALGYGYGLVMLAVSISWIHVLGIWIAVLLVAFEALFVGLLGLALRLTSNLRFWPVAAALCWSLVEFTYSRIPFGGFGWTRLAYAAVDTPLAGFLPIVGVAGMSFLVALVGQLVAYAVVELVKMRPELVETQGAPFDRLRARQGLRARPVLVAAAAVLAIAAVGTGIRLFQVEPAVSAAGSVNVGIVQGNVPGRGIEALGRMRSVTNNHLAETINLTAKSRLGGVPQPDFVLWPENSTDIDPTRDPVTLRTVQAAAEIAGVPILVGAVMAGPGPDERQTTALWWDPDRGIVARYDKRNLVPFGEWIPFRQQLLPLVPILAEVGAQSVPGTEPGVLTVPVGDRVIRVGDAICFELAYDRTIYDTIRGGAQISLVQSNNATYGGTGQIEQQFAITRARAMETRREIAVATTNSVSGFIDRDGNVVLRTTEFTADSTVVAMPLRSAVTPAVLIAPWLDRALAAAGLLCCLAGAVLAASRRRRPEPVRVAASATEREKDAVR